MKHNFIRAAILASLLLAAPVHAEESAKVFLEKIDGRDQAAAADYTGRAFFIYVGFSWALSLVVYEGQKAFYCPPQKLAMTPDQIVSVMRNYVIKNPDDGDLPAGLALLNAIQETFPCEPTAQ